MPLLLDFRSFLKNSEIDGVFHHILASFREGGGTRNQKSLPGDVGCICAAISISSYTSILTNTVFDVGVNLISVCIMLVPLECAELAGICTKWFGLGQEDPLEKGMATHSSILAWDIPWTKEVGRLQSLRLQRIGHNLVTKQQQCVSSKQYSPSNPPLPRL